MRTFATRPDDGSHALRGSREEEEKFLKASKTTLRQNRLLLVAVFMLSFTIASLLFQRSSEQEYSNVDINRSGGFAGFDARTRSGIHGTGGRGDIDQQRLYEDSSAMNRARMHHLSDENGRLRGRSDMESLHEGYNKPSDDNEAVSVDGTDAAGVRVADHGNAPGQAFRHILTRRADWEREGVPGWCSDLIREPRPWGAVPGTTHGKVPCARRNLTGECFDGSKVQFFSQHHQGTHISITLFAPLHLHSPWGSIREKSRSLAHGY